MAWTTPRTWVVGETLTAALLNTHVRDNENDIDTRLDDLESAGAVRLLAAGGAEVSTTSTSAADMVTFGSLSVPLTSELIVTCTARKGSGAAASEAVYLVVNSTSLVQVIVTNANNEADFAYVQFRVPPYIASYTYLAYGYSQARSAGSTNTYANGVLLGARPNAVITSVKIQASVSSASISGFVGAARLYEAPGA